MSEPTASEPMGTAFGAGSPLAGRHSIRTPSGSEAALVSEPAGSEPMGTVPVTVAAGFCDGCGKASPACPGCRRPFDPPRYCERCGSRLRVIVTPVRVQTLCSTHGDVGRG